ncbi:cytochrome P450 [Trametes polyzona]|nr:cytochrome P450 [Trametes polyzona]
MFVVFSNSWPLTVAAAGLLLSALLVRALFKAKRLNLPPGPKGIPILGNVHQLPLEFAERVMFKWGKTYGDVVYFRLFRTKVLLLSSIEAAFDLMDKRGLKYSDRPRMVLSNELLEASTLGSLPYGDLYRKHRKWMTDFMVRKTTLDGYQDIQRREIRNFLRNLNDTPEQFLDHIHLYLASILLEITYGLPIKSLDDEIVRLADRAIHGTNAAGRPGAVPVDFFPILKYIPTWVPFIKFKKNAVLVRSQIRQWLDTGYETVVSAIASGKAAPCVLSTALAECNGAPTPTEAYDIKYLAFNVYGAGVETSRGTLTVFFLAMTRNPEVWRKAQEEIDRVIGRERLIDFNDRESLPYLNGIVEEVYRWRPALPMGVPHRVMSDDQYRDLDIPGGCMVIPNVWAFTRDPRYYPDPEEFRPERHMPSSDGKGGEKLLPSNFTFGFGRRACPGQAFADASIWLAISNIIALFDILKPLDSAGNEITPPAKFLSGYTCRPAPFECRIVPRSEKTAAILRAYGDA